MKKLISAIALSLAFISTSSLANPLDRVSKAAVYGPEIKKLNVVDHEFNIKKAMVNQFPNGTKKITGQISHHLTARKDDQIYYTIIKKGDVILDIKREISRGGGSRMLAPFISAAGLVYGKPISPNAINRVGSSFGSLTDGEWEPAVDMIIEHIAYSF